MTTLTDIGAIQEAESGIGLSETIARIAGAGNTKGLYWDVMMGRTIVPSYISRLTARGRFLSEFSTYAPSLFLPLTHTAVPTIAATGTTGTFTRATASTWKNNDGYLVTGVAGEIGFVGARRVRNLIQTKSEDYTNAAWSKSGATAPTAGSVLASAGAGFHYIKNIIGITPVATQVFAVQLEVKRDNNDWMWFGADDSHINYFNTATGQFGNLAAGVSNATATLLSDGYYRITATCTNTTTALAPEVGLANANGGASFVAAGTESVFARKNQLEDVTAQTTQTAGEYVSVGVGDISIYVPNSTFDTDTSWTKEVGWSISGGTANYNAAVASTIYQANLLIVGRSYEITYTISNYVSGTFAARAGTATGTTRTANGTYTEVLTPPATGILGFYGAVGNVATQGSIDNVIVKALDHGSFVDGVKCFPYDINGSPIPSSTLLGGQFDGARTNLCLQSNAFTTTWTAAGTPAATQNAVGPDGATSAWTLTDDTAAATESIGQGIALTAATYTYSVFVKKTTGAQSSYPAISVYDGVSRTAACTIDTTNGVATAWTAYTGLTVQTSSATCVSHNSSFWRVSLTFLATAATWTHYLLPAATTNATQSTGVFDVTAQGSAVFYGAQVELGAFASSYIPTTTIAVARNIDLDKYTTAGHLTASAATGHIEWTPQAAGAVLGTSYLGGTAVDGSNYVNLYHSGTTLTLRKTVGGVNYDATISLTAVAGTTYKIAWTFDTSAGSNLYLNGTKGTGNANTSALQLGTYWFIGADGTGVASGNGNFRNERLWQRSLSDSEAKAVTA